MATIDDIDTVRLLIADTAEESFERLLSDAQLDAFLTLNGGVVRLAAADALEAIAVSEVLVSKKIQSQHLSTDGPAVAKALRELAAMQRQLAAADDEGFFDIADTVTDGGHVEHTNYEAWGL